MLKNILIGLYFIAASSIMIMIMIIPGQMVFHYAEAAGWLRLNTLIVLIPTIIVSMSLGFAFGFKALSIFEKFDK